MLEDEPCLDNQPFWLRTVEPDTQLKANRQALVDEIGHANFKQYLIINDRPRARWWAISARHQGPAPRRPRGGSSGRRSERVRSFSCRSPPGWVSIWNMTLWGGLTSRRGNTVGRLPRRLGLDRPRIPGLGGM